MVATDYDFLNDRTGIIEAALRKVGGFSEGEVMSDYKKQNSIKALNTLVQSWQNKSVFLWTEKVALISTVANIASYAIPTDPTTASPFISIDSAFIRQSNQDIKLEIQSWRDYQDIYRKDVQGFPSVLATDYANRLLYLSTVPDQVYSLYVFGIVKLKDFDLDAGTGDVPSKWQRALIFGLAFDLSFEYPCPQNERDAIELVAETAFKDAKKTENYGSSDVEAVESCYPRSISYR